MFEGSIRSLKVKRLNESTIAIAVAGEATVDGTWYNPRKAKCKRSIAKEHKSLPVRYWKTTFERKEQHDLVSNAAESAVSRVRQQITLHRYS